jgi:hypothetical protein
MRTRYSVLAAISIVLGLATSAAAGVPSPANSILPSRLLTAPGGSILNSIQVRDIANNPIIGSMVVIDYNNCPEFTVCPFNPALDGYVLDLPSKTIRTPTVGAAGVANFSLRAGGVCSNNGIRIFADGVLLGSIYAASFDQNGDLSVDAADVAAVHAKIGTNDLTGDINNDGAVTSYDELAVTSYANIGVNCLNATESIHRTWGSLKTIYR